MKLKDINIKEQDIKSVAAAASILLFVGLLGAVVSAYNTNKRR